jgi:co-chaperonin GroES (HSP10)
MNESPKEEEKTKMSGIVIPNNETHNKNEENYEFLNIESLQSYR